MVASLVTPLSVGPFVKKSGDTMTGNLNMSNNLVNNVGRIDFDLTFTGTVGIGDLQWNNTDGTVDLGALGGEVVLQMGQESHVRGVNKTGTSINNGESVTLVGAQGQRPILTLTDTSDSPLSDSSVGLATEDIANNAEGYITTFGIVRSLDTSAFSEGDRVWGTTTPGIISNIPSTAPSRKIFIGTVLISNANNGSIFVSPVNVPNLAALSDVFSGALTTGTVAYWDNGRFEFAPSPRFGIGEGGLEFDEITDPGAGPANTARLFTQDNGGGKTELAVRFPTGAIQTIATEP